jgi:hypothetical protein
MVAIAETIIERRSGAVEPASFRDRRQDALRELVEAKTAGLETMPLAIVEPPKVIDREEALKRSLAQDAELQPKSRRWANPRAQRPFQTAVNQRCCYPYRSREDRHSWWLDRPILVSQRRLTRQISVLGPVRVLSTN